MKKEEKKELDALRARKKRGEDYRNAYSREKYKRMTCVYPISRGAAVDEAIRQSGAASASAYLCGLIDDDLRRRGLLDDSGASAPTGGAARPVDDNRAEDSGGGDGEEVQPIERADVSRVEDGGAVDDSAGRSSAYIRHLEAGHTMRKEAGIWVWSDGERVDFEDLDDSHKLEQAIAIRRADMHAPAPAPMPSASWDDDDLPFK